MTYELKRTQCCVTPERRDDVDAHLQEVVDDGWRLVAVITADLDMSTFWEFYWERTEGTT